MTGIGQRLRRIKDDRTAKQSLESPPGPPPGPSLDEPLLRGLVESQARRDAASGMYDMAAGAHGLPTSMEHMIDRWKHRWSAEAEVAQQRDRSENVIRTRAAVRRLAVERQSNNHHRQELEEALEERDRLRRSHAATWRDEDGGDSPTMVQAGDDGRSDRAKDWLLYTAVGVSELGLNYTAFKLMGGSLHETAVLAASIILASVLLPKQIGELTMRLWRARGNRRLLAVALAGAVTLWVGVCVFVALVRTAYLLLPSSAASSAGSDSLLERAGLGSVILTVGWTLVTLAVGSVALLRAASRYQPRLREIRRADARVAKAREELALRCGDEAVAAFDLERSAESEGKLAQQWAGKQAALEGLSAELKHQYRHQLARELGNPTLTDALEAGVARAALPSPRVGSRER